MYMEHMALETMFLRKIYDTHIELSDAFDVFICVTIARFPILKFQVSISSEINLELAETNVDICEGQEYFPGFKRHVDNIRSGKIGRCINHDRGSKFVFSTRNIDLIEEMKSEESMKIKPFSTDKRWDLFFLSGFQRGRRGSCS